MSLRQLGKKYNRNPSTIRWTLNYYGFTDFRKGHKGTNGLIGKKLTKEHKQNIRESKMGSKNPSWKDAKLKGHCSHCGKYIEDHKCGRTEIKYCDNKCQIKHQGVWNKGKSCFVGKDNPNWQGGVKNLQTRIRYSYKGEEWIKKVFKRDDYTCQRCNERGGHLHAHHIITYKHLFDLFKHLHCEIGVIEDSDILLELSYTFHMFFNVDNGVSLCETCHRKLHKQGDTKMKKTFNEVKKCAAELL